jgi:hypothetical protein
VAREPPPVRALKKPAREFATDNSLARTKLSERQHPSTLSFRAAATPLSVRDGSAAGAAIADADPEAT